MLLSTICHASTLKQILFSSWRICKFCKAFGLCNICKFSATLETKKCSATKMNTQLFGDKIKSQLKYSGAKNINKCIAGFTPSICSVKSCKVDKRFMQNGFHRISMLHVKSLEVSFSIGELSLLRSVDNHLK